MKPITLIYIILLALGMAQPIYMANSHHPISELVLRYAPEFIIIYLIIIILQTLTILFACLKYPYIKKYFFPAFSAFVFFIALAHIILAVIMIKGGIYQFIGFDEPIYLIMALLQLVLCIFAALHFRPEKSTTTTQNQSLENETS